MGPNRFYLSISPSAPCSLLLFKGYINWNEDCSASKSPDFSQIGHFAVKLPVMKFLILVSFCFTLVVSQNRFPAKPNIRKLPADVLRDFPGVCFGSSACRIFHVGQSWPLAPFCGRATCLKEGDKLVEEVEDCGLPPKRTPGCRIANEADFQKPYPECCPVYECQEGAKLQYPTQEEIAAAARERAAKAAAAARSAKGDAA